MTPEDYFEEPARERHREIHTEAQWRWHLSYVSPGLTVLVAFENRREDHDCKFGDKGSDFTLSKCHCIVSALFEAMKTPRDTA